MRRMCLFPFTGLLLVGTSVVPWLLVASLGASGETEYVGDSRQCAKCHGKDGNKHLPHTNSWRNTTHARVGPSTADPLTQQFRRSTGFIVSQAGKGDWLEKGVGCESCHGPNDPHTRTKTREEAIKTTYAGRVAMLEEAAKATDPAKAPFAEAEVARTLKAAMMCGQCHASFRARSGRDFPEGFTLRPDGTHDLSAVATMAAPDDAMKTTQSEYHDWLAGGDDKGQSKHASKGVWCGTCHDPHANGKDPKHPQLRLPVNQLCGSCHKKEAADLQAHLSDPMQKHIPGIKAKPGMECIPCHMPARTYGVTRDKPNHSHVMSNGEARKYEEDNKGMLTASVAPTHTWLTRLFRRP